MLYVIRRAAASRLLLGLFFALVPLRSRAAAVPHVILISLDGLGAKYLQFFVTNAPARFPNFNRLVHEGASTFNARCDYDASITIPNHITMFTGRPVLQPTNALLVPHGYTSDFPGPTDTIHNSGNPLVPYKASFFDVAHDFGFSTAVYLGKTRLQICDRSYDATNGAADTNAVAGDNGRDKIDGGLVASSSDYSGTTGVSNEVNALLQDLTNAQPKRCTFIHLAEPDLTGHSSGWHSANWSNMVVFIDSQLERILAAIGNNPALSNQTALLVTADHGGGGVTENNHQEAYQITNYTIPLLLWGSGIPAGGNAYDLFANRADPGTNRVNYSTIPQPLRDGDIGNIALALLGLPPIPDSFIVPIVGATNVTMNVARAVNGTCILWWPGNAQAFTLEGASLLGGVGSWTGVTNGIQNNGGVSMYAATNSPDLRFYRLRKL